MVNIALNRPANPLLYSTFLLKSANRDREGEMKAFVHNETACLGINALCLFTQQTKNNKGDECLVYATSFQIHLTLLGSFVSDRGNV